LSTENGCRAVDLTEVSERYLGDKSVDCKFIQTRPRRLATRAQCATDATHYEIHLDKWLNNVKFTPAPPCRVVISRRPRVSHKGRGLVARRQRADGRMGDCELLISPGWRTMPRKGRELCRMLNNEGNFQRNYSADNQIDTERRVACEWASLASRQYWW